MKRRVSSTAWQESLSRELEQLAQTCSLQLCPPEWLRGGEMKELTSIALLASNMLSLSFSTVPKILESITTSHSIVSRGQQMR
jgi:hypothetical protein